MLPKLLRQGASLLANIFGVGFIDWLGNGAQSTSNLVRKPSANPNDGAREAIKIDSNQSKEGDMTNVFGNGPERKENKCV
jgi:hypothetical protein